MTIIRPATPHDAHAIATVHVETWRSAYRGIVPDEYLANLSIPKRHEFWAKALSSPAQDSQVFVAVKGENQVVGFSSAGRSRSQDLAVDGEVMAIYLLEECQGQGIGRKLLQASINQLVEDGRQSMLVWVLEDNPTCRFYAHMGGAPLTEAMENIGGRELKEIAFCWEDLPAYATQKHIYHIVDRSAWIQAQETGVYQHPSLQTEGFIHCSDREQLMPVAKRHFTGQTDLLVLDIDAAKLKARLTYENTSGGTELFPHLYGTLNLDAVLVAYKLAQLNR